MDQSQSVRTDISFPSDRVVLRGWLFTPSGQRPAAGWPTVVAAEGFAGVKEVALETMGEAFARAGLATVAFDYPYFGESEGQPRQLIDPEAQVRAYRASIAFAATHPELDANRIGAWGASFAGGHVLRLASTPSGLKAAVAVVPHMNAHLTSRLGPGLRHPLALLQRRYPVVSRDNTGPAVMQDEHGYRFLVEDVARRALRWQNWIDVRSLPKVARYRPLAKGTAPTIPIRYVVAEGDHITPPAAVRELAARTLAPNDLIELPGTHFDIYGPHAEQMVSASIDWLRNQL
ncbi:alpha/beta hydrolase [Streptomyces cacaoi]|uniref:alpha/beta hydrolase n=1 Tax=Streptomyces cacaoi TaxID=1898 RepID=UPI00260AA59D|nr:alpha/beta hydrolase [Streptomyces cacaoi]